MNCRVWSAFLLRVLLEQMFVLTVIKILISKLSETIRRCVLKVTQSL